MINKKEREIEAKRIGSLIAQLRKERGLTQSEMAKMMGVKQNFLSSLENGNHVPYEETRKKAANVLGIPIEVLHTPIPDHRYEPRSVRKMKHDRSKLGKLFHEARMKKNLTLTKLATITGISRARLNNYENTERVPMSEKDLRTIAHALELDMEFLLTIWVRRGIPESERVFGNRLLCIRCKKKRLFNEFHAQPRKNNLYGYSKYCKYCVSERRKAAARMKKENGKNA